MNNSKKIEKQQEKASCYITSRAHVSPVSTGDGIVMKARAQRMNALVRLRIQYEKCQAELDAMIASGSNDTARMNTLRRVIANLAELHSREDMRRELVSRTR